MQEDFFFFFNKKIRRGVGNGKIEFQNRKLIKLQLVCVGVRMHYVAGLEVVQASILQ